MILVLLFILLFYRPFIIAMWTIDHVWFLVFLAIVALIAIRKRRNQSSLYIERYFITFAYSFTVFLFVMIMRFSTTTGEHCEKMERGPGVRPVFSLCDSKNQELARRYSPAVYHCRNAFLSADRMLVYVGFGAETMMARQVLLGVNRKTLKVERVLPTKTVFRAYCNPKLKDCVFLVSPYEDIRLWDDEKQSIIKDFYSPRDRPRFLSVDPNGYRVYVASDANWIAQINLASRGIEKKIKMPTGALLTVTNTRKRVIATRNYFFRPYIMIYDKKSGDIDDIAVGGRYLWKNLGFLFHVEADPDGERVFVAAPFECAVYAFDLERKKTVWRQKLPIGIRDMAYDRKRKMLYCANFVDGYIYRIDASGAKPRLKGRVFAGSRIRFLSYEPDEDVILSASANGVVEYDLSSMTAQVEKGTIRP
jgi:hypothetical protein